MFGVIPTRGRPHPPARQYKGKKRGWSRDGRGRTGRGNETRDREWKEGSMKGRRKGRREAKEGE